jgi:hypothetical protein
MMLHILLGLLASSSIAAQIAGTSTLSLKTVDAQSGSAIGGVQIDIVGVGSRVTDSGGVARFEVLRLDSATIVARKIGYARSMIAVSLRDSTKITVRLQKVANLPSVTVREDGVAPDLLHKLRTVGFIERRTSSAAPSSSFITDADIKRWKPQLVSDITARLGKPVANCTAYVDGVAVNTSGRAMGMRQGIDVLFLPSELAAVEVYVRSSVTPSQFPARGRSSCVVLYWLR